MAENNGQIDRRISSDAQITSTIHESVIRFRIFYRLWQMEIQNFCYANSNGCVTNIIPKIRTYSSQNITFYMQTIHTNTHFSCNHCIYSMLMNDLDVFHLMNSENSNYNVLSLTEKHVLHEWIWKRRHRREHNMETQILSIHLTSNRSVFIFELFESVRNFSVIHFFCFWNKTGWIMNNQANRKLHEYFYRTI